MAEGQAHAARTRAVPSHVSDGTLSTECTLGLGGASCVDGSARPPPARALRDLQREEQRRVDDERRGGREQRAGGGEAAQQRRAEQQPQLDQVDAVPRVAQVLHDRAAQQQLVERFWKREAG